MGTTILTFEEFNTLLTNIEVFVNSRQLTVLSSDPNEMSYHFFIGTLIGLPDSNVEPPKVINDVKRWNHF